MKKIIIYAITVIFILFALFSCGCQKEKKEQPITKTPRSQKVTTEPKEEKADLENEVKYVYEPNGRRDPFKPILSFQSKVDIDKIKLVGFATNSKGKTKAIVEDETGNSHYLSEGDFLGQAKVVSLDIKEKKLIFEIQKDYYTTKKTLQLEASDE